MDSSKGEKELFFNSSCRVLVIGSSGAIGSAMVRNLRPLVGSGNVSTISRKNDGLDFLHPKTIEKVALQQDGSFQLILDATGALEIDGALPEKTLNSLDHDQMLNQFKVNAIGPALLIKHFMGLLPRSGKVVFASLSARVGSIGDNRLGGWISYRASKAALNQIIKTAAIECTRKNPESVFIGLHPGTVRSKLTERYLGNHAFVEADQAAKNIIHVIEQKNFKDTGGFFAYDGELISY